MLKMMDKINVHTGNVSTLSRHVADGNSSFLLDFFCLKKYRKDFKDNHKMIHC